jgi:hypothetical protein
MYEYCYSSGFSTLSHYKNGVFLKMYPHLGFNKANPILSLVPILYVEMIYYSLPDHSYNNNTSLSIRNMETKKWKKQDSQGP